MIVGSIFTESIKRRLRYWWRWRCKVCSRGVPEAINYVKRNCCKKAQSSRSAFIISSLSSKHKIVRVSKPYGHGAVWQGKAPVLHTVIIKWAYHIWTPSMWGHFQSWMWHLRCDSQTFRNTVSRNWNELLCKSTIAKEEPVGLFYNTLMHQNMEHDQEEKLCGEVLMAMVLETSRFRPPSFIRY